VNRYTVFGFLKVGTAEKWLFIYYAYSNNANEKLTTNEDQRKTQGIEKAKTKWIKQIKL